MALTDQGKVFSWGDNSQSQVGVSNTEEDSHSDEDEEEQDDFDPESSQHKKSDSIELIENSLEHTGSVDSSTMGRNDKYQTLKYVGVPKLIDDVQGEAMHISCGDYSSIAISKI